MDTLNPHTAITLPSDCCNKFCGIAFDGCFFYFTAPQECCINKFKRDFTMISNFKTDNPYHCICYDNIENCFWVTENKRNNIIYKLDRNMKEIDLLRIKNCPKTCSPIVGLSHDCEKDILLAAYKDYIIEVSKKSGCACIIRDACAGFYTGISSIAPYYALIQREEKGQNFQIINRDGRQIKTFRIPALYSIKDALFYPCNKRCKDEFEFISLTTKDDCSQIILFKINICDMILCSCNYKVCCTHCGEEDENEQCICDVIESIALVETSLSHILNAEGEKLQKAVELACSIDELLAVNRSVTKAIITITQLEHQLYLKLDALNDICRTPGLQSCK